MLIPAALEEIEKRCWHDIWHTAVCDAVVDYRIDLVRFGPVQASIVPEQPSEPSLNLILGAATPGAIEAGHLGNAIDWASAHAVDYRVPVTPGRPGTKRAEEWLSETGHEQGASRAKLVRDASAPTPPAPRAIEAVERGRPNEDEGFPDAFAESLGMPGWASTFFFDLPGTEGWRCYVAAEDDCPLAYVAMLVHAGVAELMLAGEPRWRPERVPEGQAALLHLCVEEAAEAGCAAIFAEVEEPRPGERPSSTRESLLLAGFEQAFLRAEWRPPRHAVAEKGLRCAWA